ncbi:hypothetical protein A3844_08400 [Paenibacillus helianthi]|uniref:Uncharacterized protein n=1 Tax=Paenibacillus helianthi TaxID=1349432 RepID=A0ABX3EV81_9BACL|nr:hypothetical protein A3848_21965 [Paenibacillus sp. P32E]OKP88379.1 hypothetical protein A3844_08400 [Paenibacillus helianthi]
MKDKLEVLDKNLVPVGKLVSAYEETRKRRMNSDYEMSFLVPMISEDSGLRRSKNLRIKQ